MEDNFSRRLEKFEIMNNIKIERAKIEDAAEILGLQKVAFLSEAKLYNCSEIAPMREPIEKIEQDIQSKIVLKAVSSSKVIGVIRGFLEDNTCQITRFCVHPDFQNKGIGKRLISEIEKYFNNAKRYELWTGDRSTRNLCLYQRLGYKIFKTEKFDENGNTVYLEKMTHK